MTFLAPLVADVTRPAPAEMDALIYVAVEATIWYDNGERSDANANFTGAALYNVRIARWKSGLRFANKMTENITKRKTKDGSLRLTEIDANVFFFLRQRDYIVDSIREEISSEDSPKMCAQ